MPRIRPVLLLLPALMFAWGTPCIGADDALVTAARSPASSAVAASPEAGDLLFTALELRRTPLDFQPQLQKCDIEPANEKAAPHTEVFICGTSLLRYHFELSEKWNRLAQLDRAKISALTLDDDLLQMAYSEVFLSVFDRNDEVPSWYKVAEADLRRRGDAATPLLLQLFDQHPEPRFRENLLTGIDTFPTISLAPYLQAARNYWWTLGTKTPPRTCHAIGRLLSRHGSADDMKILQEMQSHGSSEVTTMATSDIRRLTERLKAAPKPSH